LVFRKAVIDDLKQIAEIEKICFPAAEAASEKSFEGRIKCCPDHFWIMEDGGRIVAFVNNMAVNQKHLTDNMYEDAYMHDKNGEWEMVLSVCTIPEYRKKGIAESLLHKMIEECRMNGRKGIVLACKDYLIHYYEKFGFIDEGISESTYGNAVWHEMRITF